MSRQDQPSATPSLLAVVSSASDAIQLRPVLELLARRSSIKPKLCLAGALAGEAQAIARQFEVACHLELEGLTPDAAFCSVLQEVARVLRSESPTWLLCCGESNAAAAASQAAALLGVNVAHMDAGANGATVSREDFLQAPHAALDHQARWCFAPSVSARENLLARGVPPERICVSGSTKIDALLDLRERVAYRPAEDFADQLGSAAHLRLAYWDEKVVLAVDDHQASAQSAHSTRRGNWTELIARAAQAHPEWLFLCSGSDAVNARLSANSNVVSCPSLNHEAFVWALARCDLILTRSSEVQEYAEVMGTPVIAVGVKNARSRALVSEADVHKIQAAIELVLESDSIRQNLISPRHALEDGLAAERIVGLLLRAPATQVTAEAPARKAVSA